MRPWDPTPDPKTRTLTPGTQALNPGSPCGTRLDAQHVPGVFAVADAANGVGLLFGEAHADLGHRTLPAILTHVSDG